MSFSKIAVLTAILFFSKTTWADEPKFVLGTINSWSYPGKSLSDHCTLTDTKSIPEGQIVLIIGIRDCSARYLSSRSFYEIAWRGETFFVEKEKIFLRDEDSNRIPEFSQQDWDKAREDGLYASNVLRRDELKGLLDALSSTKPYGAAIIDWSVIDESEYTQGTGLRIQAFNPTDKTIKYMWFTIQAYNPVDDPVGGPVTVKAVGPIKPDTSGVYRFEYSWMTDLVDTAKFRQIKVQYTDGTIKIIASPNKVILDKKIAAIYNEE